MGASLRWDGKREIDSKSKVLLFSKHHKIANAVKTLDFVFPKKWCEFSKIIKFKESAKGGRLITLHPILWNRHIIKAKSQKLDNFGVANLFPCHFKSTTKNERIFFAQKSTDPIQLTLWPPLFPSLPEQPLESSTSGRLAPWCSPSALLFDPGLIYNSVRVCYEKNGDFGQVKFLQNMRKWKWDKGVPAWAAASKVLLAWKNLTSLRFVRKGPDQDKCR